MLKKYTHHSVVTSIISIVILLALLSGCAYSGGSTSTNTKEIKHLGGVTKVSSTPKNIVALEFSIVDNLYQLGIKPVGIADDADTQRIIEPIKTFVQGYTSVGKRAQPNLEVIQSVQPDLIIGDAKRHSEIYTQLSQIAPTILVKSVEGTFSELEEAFKTIASVFGKEEKAAEVILKSNKRIEEVKQQLVGKGIKTQTIMPIVPEAKSINVHTSASYIGNVIEKLGLKHSTISSNVYSEMTLEQLSANRPQIMLFMRKTEGTIIDTWKENSLYQSLPAVTLKNVHYVNPDIWSRFRGYESLHVILSDFEKLGNDVHA